MNIYFLVSGIIALLGGFAHAFLGHKWTINAIDADTLKSTQNSKEQDKRFLVWFWHIGSVVLLSTAILLVTQGSGIYMISKDLIMYISFLWLSITGVFIIVAVKKPNQIFKMIPGLVGVPINILILIGLNL